MTLPIDRKASQPPPKRPSLRVVVAHRPTLEDRLQRVARQMGGIIMQVRRRGLDGQADDMTAARDAFVKAARRVLDEREQASR